MIFSAQNQIEAWDNFLKEQEKKGARVVHLHTSDHADPNIIAEVIKEVAPREAIYPIHTEKAAGFYALNIPQELKERIVTLY